jgi:hypothetical protein
MRKLAIGLFLVIAAGLAIRTLRSDGSDTALLFDRFWIDHQPRDGREKFEALFVSGAHPGGQFATQTVWSGQWEGFHYHVVPRERGTLELMFPASDRRERVRYTARRCQERGFDFCLELSGTGRGSQRYYSRKEWRATEGELTGERLRALLEAR